MKNEAQQRNSKIDVPEVAYYKNCTLCLSLPSRSLIGACYTNESYTVAAFATKSVPLERTVESMGHDLLPVAVALPSLFEPAAGKYPR